MFGCSVHAVIKAVPSVSLAAGKNLQERRCSAIKCKLNLFGTTVCFGCYDAVYASGVEAVLVIMLYEERGCGYGNGTELVQRIDGNPKMPAAAEDEHDTVSALYTK